MNNSITTEAFFTGIKPKLLAEIGLARQSLTAAVAWFTDRDLLAALVKQQKAGITVTLALTHDSINEALDFTALTAAGGRVFHIEGALMHNKFCVLDGRDVITGSYNWTYRAAHENYENIVLTSGDYDLAYRYLAEFARITGQSAASAATNPGAGPDLAKIVRRLHAIRSLVQLDEPEDTLRQARRLHLEWPDPLAGQLLAQLEAGHYAAALTGLEAFLQLQARLTIYEDPLLAALRLEVRDLQYRLVAVEAEIAESEHLLSQYNHEFARQVGALTEEILRLKQAYAHHQRQQSPFAETEYEEARRRYDDFRQEYAAEARKTVLPLDADDQQMLRKLYRHCATLCHPDKVAEHLRPQAEAAFKRLQVLHDRQDLAQLQALAAELAQGIFDPAAAPDTITADRAALQARRDYLARQLAQALANLAVLHTNPTYQQVSTVPDLTHHFQELHAELTQELARWQQLVPADAPATS
ncbi:phospholipase D-like domain-containing protein [Hymenobacter glacialis]|uniref:phospholipase D-like domain-containing protein n=1 Tax=Hymenobacter glacialis TaxID=1908236 RepID=UPI000ABCA297|nr:phospholipase D-like domain-containing protein [Hymenobacter glacialis]